MLEARAWGEGAKSIWTIWKFSPVNVGLPANKSLIDRGQISRLLKFLRRKARKTPKNLAEKALEDQNLLANDPIESVHVSCSAEEYIPRTVLYSLPMISFAFVLSI